MNNAENKLVHLDPTPNLALERLNADAELNPDALNASLTTLDAVVAEIRQAAASGGAATEAVEALASQMTAALGSSYKNCRVNASYFRGIGSYGVNAKRTFNFPAGFRPVLLIITADSSTSSPIGIGIVDCPLLWTNSGQSCPVDWYDGHLTFYHDNSAEYSFNKANTFYHYIMLGYDT